MKSNPAAFDEIDHLAINALRVLSAEMVEKAQSGHPGLPMGAAAVAYVLWSRFLKFSPKHPLWPNRDRFILSAGHGSALLYSLLYLTGYDLSLEDIKNFRQLGSPCAGHPEYGELDGVETTTGPLAQGLGVSVGMAMAETYLAAHLNRDGYPIMDHTIYCLAGDGCLMEGLSHEAASLAGHLGLGKLIVLYDSNRISIDGSTEITFTEDVSRRFEAYNWQVLHADGLDLAQVELSLSQAKRNLNQPSLIICRTRIGYGSPHKQDRASSHGAPLGEEELRLTKEKLAWKEKESFSVPPSVTERMGGWGKKGDKDAQLWEDLFVGFSKEHPREAAQFVQAKEEKMAADLFEGLPSFKPEDPPIATRSASGKIINYLSQKTPFLWGGSADLSESNNTLVDHAVDFQKETPKGRNIRFGVREHAMGAILNGIAHSGLVIPYGGTFLIFSDYMRPSIRLACLMGLPVIYVFTHDSVFLGEDGPTHQPIEQLATLRALPKLYVIRPADAKETAAAWQYALENYHKGPKGHPFALCLTRQKVPILKGTQGRTDQGGFSKGAYVVVNEKAKLALVLIGTGSEVSLCVEVAAELEKRHIGVRVLSMPCRELFDQQDAHYRDEILPPQIQKKMVVEAALPMGWESLVGKEGRVFGIERFGTCAPQKDLEKFFGFTKENLVQKALEYLRD